jgi:hypothetical protein
MINVRENAQRSHTEVFSISSKGKLVVRSIVELRRGRRCVCRNRLGRLKRSVVSKVNRNPRAPERMARDRGRHTGINRADLLLYSKARQPRENEGLEKSKGKERKTEAPEWPRIDVSG